ncbi:unnamed protein product, partial [marine sediment metagenome]
GGYRGTVTGNRDILDCALEALDVWWATNKNDLSLRVLAEADKMLRAAYHPESKIWLRLPGAGQQVQAEWRWAMDEDFNACDPDSDDAAYAGIIDYVEWGKGVVLADHKTIRKMVSNADLATDMQGWLYCLWAMSQFFPVAEVEWRLNMIRHGYSARHTFTREGGWMKRAKRFFRTIRDALIEAERDDCYPETVGDGCGWCARRHDCDALGLLMENGSVPGDSSPEAIGRAHLALSKLSRQYTAAAKKLAEDGDIDVGLAGKVLGFKPIVKDKWSITLSQ